jgi:methionine-rich copper-binding protein CopC
MSVRRLSAALLLAGTALLATAAPALAHTELKSSDPAKGASLPSAPQQITLTFNEAVQSVGVDIKIGGPGGAQWNVHQPVVKGGVVTAVVKGGVVTAVVVPSGPAGDYTIAWRVFADDGDAISGKIPFKLTSAAVAVPSTTPPAPVQTTTSQSSPPSSVQFTPTVPTTQPGVDPAAQQQQTDGGNGVPVWLWIIIAVVVIAAVVIFVLRAKRSKPSAE